MMAEQPDIDSIAAGYDVGAAGYDERHGAARSITRFQIIDRPQLDAVRNARRVLELGCGTGRLLRQVRAPERIGIDISLGMLSQAPPWLSRAQADAHSLPFADESFDGMLAGKGTFRYLDYDRAFAECARVLQVGGCLGTHEYAPVTWSPRDLFRSTTKAPPASELLERLRAAAASAGLVCDSTHLWRSIRLYPYALPIPEWLPGNTWSHCVLIFRKP